MRIRVISTRIKPWKDTNIKILLFALYILIYLIFSPLMGIATGILVTIPVLSVTWFYGIGNGLVAWMVGVLLNMAMRALIGEAWQTALTDGSGVGTGILFVIVWVVGHMRNTSLSLKQELAKRQQIEVELKALYNATSQLFNAESLLRLGEQIVQALVEEFKQGDCQLFLLDPQSQTANRLAYAGSRINTLPHSLSLKDMGIVPDAIRGETVIYLSNLRTDPRYAVTSLSTGSELVIPLQTARGVIGVLDIFSPCVNGFNEQTRRVLTAYAERVTPSIETQLLNDEIQRYVGELEWRVLQRTAELQKAKEHIEAILANSSDTIILVSSEGIIQEVNPAFTRLSGYEARQVIGQSLLMLSDTHSAFDLQQALAEVKQDGQQARIEMCIKRSNANQVDVDVAISSVHDEAGKLVGIICNIRDITDSRRAAEAVRQSQAQLQAIMDNTQSIIYVKDTTGRYLLVNRQFEQDFGVTRNALRGKADYDIFPQAIADTLIANDQQVLKTGEAFVFEETVPFDDDIHTYLSNKFPVLDASGAIYGVCGISTDITKRKEVEDSLRVALEREKELNALKSGFTSMISHEFRTPLAVISTSSEMLSDYYQHLSDEKRVYQLNKIKQQVIRLTDLMNNVLLVSKADTVGLSFTPSATDIVELGQNIIEEVTLAQLDNICVDFRHQGVDGQYLIDSNLFRHIFQNLLSNAIKYSRPTTTVAVRLQYSDCTLMLIVQDEGIGIPNEHQKNLFKTFHRATNVGTRPGTGLGLAIVKRAVDEHGGSLEFTSIEEEGTMFIVSLPVERLYSDEQEAYNPGN